MSQQLNNNNNNNPKTTDDFVYCQLSVPCVDKDEKEEGVDIIVRFESQEHYDDVEGDMFDTMGPLVNIYLSTSALFKDKELWVDDTIECVKFLKQKPSNNQYMIVVKTNN